MTTPLATIADALIEFILSLLRDPEAAAAFEEDPQEALATAGMGDICAADVRSVLPVIVDRPDVTPVIRPEITVTVPPPSVPQPPVQELIREIQNVVNNFAIDNRTAIFDQSVNQSIWADGDVTQYFDQEAVIAFGDHAVAAGNNADVNNSTTDIDAGDINIGNNDIDTTINDSFNDSSTNVDADLDADVDDSFNDNSTNTDVDIDVEDSFNDESNVVSNESTVVDNSGNVNSPDAQAQSPAPPAPEPAYSPPEDMVEEAPSYDDSMDSDEPEYETDLEDQF